MGKGRWTAEAKAHGRNREAAFGDEEKGLGGGGAGSGIAEPCLPHCLIPGEAGKVGPYYSSSGVWLRSLSLM